MSYLELSGSCPYDKAILKGYFTQNEKYPII